MYAKTAFVICAQALLIQLALGQAIYPSASTLGNAFENTVNNVIAGGSSAAIANSGLGLAGSGLGLTGSGLGLANNGFGANLVNNVVDIVPNPVYLSIASLSGGGVLPVTSYSPLVPSGMTVVSDNAIEGQVVVNGKLPFLSAVAFEGSMSSDGQGSTSCGCGDGSIGIVSENFTPAASAVGLGGLGGFGFNGLGRGAFGGRFV